MAYVHHYKHDNTGYMLMGPEGLFKR